MTEDEARAYFRKVAEVRLERSGGNLADAKESFTTALDGGGGYELGKAAEVLRKAALAREIDAAFEAAKATES